MEADRLIIMLGASVRAAAQSAVRAGWRVFSFDLFADTDLASVAHASRIPAADYPHGLPILLKSIPSLVPWMYTGGIENHPRLIAKLCESRPLVGNYADVVSQARDRKWLASVAQCAGWRVPPQWEPKMARGIRKPTDHCGGIGTCELTGQDAPSTSEGEAWESGFVEGPSYAGILLGEVATRRAGCVSPLIVDRPRGRLLVEPTIRGLTSPAHRMRLLGITRQYVARDFTNHVLRHRHPFAYTGSSGPIKLGSADLEAWNRLADELGKTNLRGLIGVDAIRDPHNGWTLIEINPRWTASIELLEITSGIHAFALHVNACGAKQIDSHPTSRTSRPNQNAEPERSAAKLIWFAPHAIHTDQPLIDSLQRLATDEGLVVRDVPRCGAEIEAGGPAWTLLARDAANLADLWQRAELIWERLSS